MWAVSLWYSAMEGGGWISRSHLTSMEIRRPLQPSYLHNGIFYTDKMTSLYWIRTQEAVAACNMSETYFNTLRPRQNGRHFADDIFKCIFLNENVWIQIKNSLKFVPQGPINNIPALVQIMAWRRSGGKPLSGPMMVRLPTHICVTRPQWVKRQISRNLIRPHHPLHLPNRFNSWHRKGVGDTKPIPFVSLFPEFFSIVKHMLSIKDHVYIDKCRRSSATVAPVKCECKSNNFRYTFARSKTFLAETLTNAALVTPTPTDITSVIAVLCAKVCKTIWQFLKKLWTQTFQTSFSGIFD